MTVKGALMKVRSDEDYAAAAARSSHPRRRIVYLLDYAPMGAGKVGLGSASGERVSLLVRWGWRVIATWEASDKAARAAERAVLDAWRDAGNPAEGYVQGRTDLLKGGGESETVSWDLADPRQACELITSILAEDATSRLLVAAELPEPRRRKVQGWRRQHPITHRRPAGRVAWAPGDPVPPLFVEA